ncbi:hypothetical protein CRUP_009564, partial [Coryphaenoides rupestris]
AVFLARDKHHLSDLCHLIRHEAPYLFQQYVKESHGRDVRVVLVGGRVIGSMQRCSTDGRMQSNCSLGGVGMMCPLSEQGKQLATQVSNILGMDVCGIDLLQLDDGSFVVCEANANVGFIAFDQACGMDVAGIVADYALSLLPGRLMLRKMSLLSAVSSSSSEPEVCCGPAGVTTVSIGGGQGGGTEAACNMSVGSTSSESDPELAEPTPPRQASDPELPDLAGLGKQLATQVSNILGMDVCGIDLLQLDDGSFVVCEANANVGFIAFDQACGMDVAGIVADYALSLLPGRLMLRKMSLLSAVSSSSSEPEVCCGPAGVTTVSIGGGQGGGTEAACNMSVGSTSSESDPELAEPTPPRQASDPELPDLAGLTTASSWGNN